MVDNLNINKNGMLLDDYNLKVERYCSTCSRGCGKLYKLEDYESSYFCSPYSYLDVCETICLNCFLFDPLEFKNDSGVQEKRAIDLNLRFPVIEGECWYDSKDEKEIIFGDFRLAYKGYTSNDCHIAVLPISRLATDKTLLLPYGVTIYPEGRLNLSDLQLKNEELEELEELTGVTLEVLNSHPLVVLPIKLIWSSICDCGHDEGLELIRSISERLDRVCFDLLRYIHCRLRYMADMKLPSSSGQISSNLMMSTALLINGNNNEAHFIAGAAFTHRITKGLGLFLTQPEWEVFPKNSEVGMLVMRAFSLYTQMLQTQSPTSKFIQGLSLLEFLAFPHEYKPFKKVKTVISEYATKSTEERKGILDFFEKLTGKKDLKTGEEIGLRTRIIHIGGCLEDLVESVAERETLFNDLDYYIRCMINHMRKHSGLSFEEYNIIKEKLKVNFPLRKSVRLSNNCGC